MRKLIDANRTQAALDWSQIDWQKIEKTVLRLQYRIFMANYGPRWKRQLSAVSAVEPYASRGARTVPGGEPAARRAPTR